MLNVLSQLQFIKQQLEFIKHHDLPRMTPQECLLELVTVSSDKQYQYYLKLALNKYNLVFAMQLHKSDLSPDEYNYVKKYHWDDYVYRNNVYQALKLSDVESINDDLLND